MAKVSLIEESDFEDLFEKYLRDDDKRLNRDHWLPLFTPLCSSIDEPIVGYKLTEGGKIVGMLGMILSQRQIESESVRFCNLHSWFVDEDQRGNSLLLLRPLLKMNDHVITDFSPTPSVIKISQRLGFQLFSMAERILPFAAKKHLTPGTEAILRWNDEVDSLQLSESDQTIYQDHADGDFHRLLVETKFENALMIIKRVTFHWRPYASVLYVSNPKLLVETQSQWQNGIRERLKINRLVGPEKYLLPGLVASYRIPFRNNQLFRSTDHGPDIIDMLYSEFSHLGLTTLPGAKTLVRGALKGLNPANWFGKKND